MPSAAHATACFKAVLINPYELGRQPFALAEPAAWLRREGFDVTCIELSQQHLTRELFTRAGLVALYLGMHTATRIAVKALPRIREFAPDTHICAYGLYAPMNAEWLHTKGVHTVLGAEPEPTLVDLARRLNGTVSDASAAHYAKARFIKPDRTPLPPLHNYAHLMLPDGERKTVGFAEATRGCKHLCRHCPVTPVWHGRFRAVPVDVVMDDIRQQVAQGAEHISFGDPDFLNGPTHALRLARVLHAEFPQVTFDATIKVQHLLDHAELLPEFKRCGCLFVTSAVESIDDRVLDYLDKNHIRADFEWAVALLRETGIALSPTFIPFTPWTALKDYIELLAALVRLRLVESVPPVQLAIRLLVPRGSYLLKLDGFEDYLDAFDPQMLGYPWRHRDPQVDRLQREVQHQVEAADRDNQPRRETFEQIWHQAHTAAGRTTPSLARRDLGAPIPALSENWYCCAEPTDLQLQGF